MINLADSKRIIAPAERRAEMISPPIAVGDDGGDLVAHVRMDRGWACWLIGACVALFAGSALFGQQAQFQGSVPTGVASATPLSLTLSDAIDRGLRTNLGLLLSGQASEITRAERMRSLSALLPQVTGAVSENVQQVDLQTKGINFRIGSFLSPAIVGPFQYTDARAYASFSVFDYSLRKSYHAAKEGERAAQLSLKDARDLVVQSVANAYLLVIAGSSRVQALRAQVETDQAVYGRTVDQKRAGTTAAIDVLRAQVQLEQEQQQLIAQENQVAKDKLALGRVIGLPSGQQLVLADKEPYSALEAMTPEEALRAAYEERADFQSAKASVRAAEDSVSAARAERYPTVGVTADYGADGTTLNNSHGTFTFQAAAKFNIFDGGRISGDTVQARAVMKQRQDELADLAAAEASYQGYLTDVPVTSTTTSSQLTSTRSGKVDAAAALLGAQRQLSAARSRLITAQANVREAEASYKRIADDVVRYKMLVDKEEISQQIYDTAVNNANSANATVDARRAAVTEAEDNIRVAQSAVDQASARIEQADASIQAALTAPQQVAISQARAKTSEAQVRQKRAAVDQARLNLSYCTIVAPVSGIIQKKSVEVGSNVSPGQELMAVVPLDDIWVTADFKEAQLRHMKPGQRVTFSVDAYGREYKGRVTGIGGASGSLLSLLPPENATGNFVKVVQRLPVRIDIDPNQNDDHRLRPGMAVEPKVYVQ